MAYKVLALFTSTNQGGKGDATGAFIPEAKSFFNHHNKGFLVGIKNDETVGKKDKPQTVAQILQDEAGQNYQCFAYFGHGTHDWAVGLGFHGNTSNYGNVNQLAYLIKKSCVPNVTVVLYACLTAQPGGFAEALAKCFITHGMWGSRVIGHVTAAHTTMNPCLVEYKVTPKGVVRTPYLPQEDGAGLPEGKALRAALASTSLRFDLPKMSVEAVMQQALAARANKPNPPDTGSKKVRTKDTRKSR